MLFSRQSAGDKQLAAEEPSRFLGRKTGTSKKGIR
jgi:hypothetical protein